MLAHLPHSPRKWAQEKPAPFQPVSTEVLPANINTLCFTFQHGPGQKATSEPNKKAALPLRDPRTTSTIWFLLHQWMEEAAPVQGFWLA